MSDKQQGNQLFNNTLLSSDLNLEDFTTASLVPVNLDDEPDIEPSVSNNTITNNSATSTSDPFDARFNESLRLEPSRRESKDSDIAPVSFFTPSADDNRVDPFSSISSPSVYSTPQVTTGTASGFGQHTSNSNSSQMSTFSSTSGLETGVGIFTPSSISSLQPKPAPMTDISLSNNNTNVNVSANPTSSPDNRIMSSTPEAPPMSSPMPPGPPPSGQTPLSNNYRLGGQKLSYAKYPGINSSPVSAPQAPPQSLNISSGGYPSVTQFTPGPPTVPDSTKQEFVNHTSNTNTPEMRLNYPAMPFPQHPATAHINNPIGSPVPETSVYSQVTFHWFYRREIDGRTVWKPFSFMDSLALEEAYTAGSDALISVNGGRFDVDIKKRLRTPIYWQEAPSEVRRCSWFYKGPLDMRFTPYEEDFAQRLEVEYYQAVSSNQWHRRIEFSGGEAVIIHNSNVIVHFCAAASPDEWGNLPENQLRPRQVKRGISDEFLIEDEESSQVDFLVFLVHGIGSICDFKFRNIVEAVDDFRHLSRQLMQTHFKGAIDSQLAGRIEFLPISWREALHGDDGIDTKLTPITLKSIPKLRHFTNDTLLDVLFYTSPKYSQKIVDHVGKEVNRIFHLFQKRNPNFNGQVAIGGHSLGSLILFDILSHQPKPADVSNPPPMEQTGDTASNNMSQSAGEHSSCSKGVGVDGPFIQYPVLDFNPIAFFALGAPIAMFCTVRGIELSEDFHFPTCPHFYNIFHPYDPIAYRMETMIWPSMELKPVLIPHHKGRKRFHLELKDQIGRVGTDLKQKFLESIKAVYQTFTRTDDNFEQAIENEMQKPGDYDPNNDYPSPPVVLGKLNSGGRVDYVLQEAPFESFNEYLFALSAHVAYWESEDTMLFIMREVYRTKGIFADNHPAQGDGPAPISNIGSPWASNVTSPATNTAPTGFPHSVGNKVDGVESLTFMSPPLQQTMPYAPTDGNRPTIIGSRPVVTPEAMINSRAGVDPTLPISSTSAGSIGPPPLTGFVRKN